MFGNRKPSSSATTHSAVVYLDSLPAQRGETGPGLIAEFDPSRVLMPTPVGSRDLSYGLRRHLTSSQDWLKVLNFLKRRHSLEQYMLCLGAGIAPVFTIDVGDTVLQPAEAESFATFQAKRLLGDRLAGYELSIEDAVTPQRCVTAVPKGLASAIETSAGHLIQRMTRKPAVRSMSMMSFALDRIPVRPSESLLLALVTPSFVQLIHKGPRGFRLFAPRDPGAGGDTLHEAIAHAEATLESPAGLSRWIVTLGCPGPGPLPGWREMDAGQELRPKVALS